MRSQAIVEFGAPLKEIEAPTPVPQGTEVLLKVLHAGVCHSDVHIHDGYFDLGNGGKLPLNLRLPHTMGHEIEGEIVALAEDHCTFGKRWCSEIKKAHDLPYAAIGGPVENNSVGSALDWAVYFYDYGKFMPPVVEGVTDSLSGNNVSFKRSVLEAVETSFREGFFEPFTHGAIQKAGHPLYLIPSALVYHQKSYRAQHSAAQCYHLARGYAARRVANASPLRRGAYALASIALPAVLTGRIVIRTLRKKRYIGKLLWALPVLFILMISWGWGECCGYLAGAGRSAAEWK